MQHQRNRNDLADLAQAVDVQLRGSLVNAVCSADSNSQRIHTGALHELSCFGRNSVAIAIAAVQIIFLAADLAQLSFHRDAGCMAGTNNFLGDLDVFLENMVRTIDHHRGVACTECFHSQLVAAAVVKMHHNRNSSLGSGSCDHGMEHSRRSVLQSTRSGLDDNGCTQLLSSGDDCLNHLHVLCIECADCIMVLLSIQHQFFGSD